MVSQHIEICICIVPSCTARTRIYEYRIYECGGIYVRTMPSYDTITSPSAVSLGLNGAQHICVSVSHDAYQLEYHTLGSSLQGYSRLPTNVHRIIVLYRYVYTSTFELFLLSNVTAVRVLVYDYSSEAASSKQQQQRVFESRDFRDRFLFSCVPCPFALPSEESLLLLTLRTNFETKSHSILKMEVSTGEAPPAQMHS